MTGLGAQTHEANPSLEGGEVEQSLHRVTADGGLAKAPEQNSGHPARSILEQALDYCNREWLPINPQIYSKVQSRFLNGTYHKKPSKLIEDLKADIGLFLHFVGKLPTVCRAESNQGLAAQLATLDIDACAEIFSRPIEGLSSHSLEYLEDSHADLIRYAVTCGSAAELIAEKKGEDPESAYACALIRQLGLALITFNYPSVFKRALCEIDQNGGSLVDEIANLLGYSPLTLGLRLLETWQLGEDVRTVVAAEDGIGGNPGHSQWIRRMRTSCHQSETLARADYPEAFPSETEAWADILGEVEEILGNRAIDDINLRLEERLYGYIQFSPGQFRRPFDPVINDEEAMRVSRAELFQKNISCQQLSRDLQREFRGIYDLMHPKRVSIEALNKIVGHLLPLFGFGGGCVYLLRPKDLVLVPRLRLGKLPISAYRSVSLAAGGALGRAISESLTSQKPVVEHRVVLHDRVLSHMTWKINNTKDVGVLHLELTDKTDTYSRKELETIFLALRIAIGDALNIR